MKNIKNNKRFVLAGLVLRLALSTLIVVHFFHPTHSVPLITQPPDEHGVLNEYIRNFREILSEAHRLYASINSGSVPVNAYMEGLPQRVDLPGPIHRHVMTDEGILELHYPIILAFSDAIQEVIEDESSSTEVQSYMPYLHSTDIAMDQVIDQIVGLMENYGMINRTLTPEVSFDNTASDIARTNRNLYVLQETEYYGLDLHYDMSLLH